jgi:hypothetical protein
MSPRLQKLKNFVNHPATQLVTGMILLISGGVEIAYDVMSTERTFRWGVHHGVAILGLVQVLGSLPECIDGIDRALKAIDKREK